MNTLYRAITESELAIENIKREELAPIEAERERPMVWNGSEYVLDRDPTRCGPNHRYILREIAARALSDVKQMASNSGATQQLVDASAAWATLGNRARSWPVNELEALRAAAVELTTPVLISERQRRRRRNARV